MGVDRPAYVRSEIHGLRAIAVLMVVAYHVWLGRVSGGVDVFLFLTGFLITGTLLRAVAAKGRPFAGAFFSRLASRLLPPVVVVIIGTLVATYMFMPRHRWTSTLQESLASLLYVENWVLATNSVDYLAQDNPPSLLQHFWSLSMQGQFYPLWFGLVLIAVWLARRHGWSIKRVVLVGAGSVFAVSFTYSLWRTATDQPWAYFDTNARLWQFAVGAILYLVIDRIRLSDRVRVILGWVGLITLVSLGVIVDVSRLFPGWVALVPITAAAAIVVAGETRSKTSVDYMLAWRPVTKLSDWSYALYLWHWPVLLVYLQVRGYDSVGLRGGLAIVVLSVVLAGVTTEALKRRPWRIPANSYWPIQMRYATAWVLPIFLVTGVGTVVLTREDTRMGELSSGLSEDTSLYPGALTIIDPEWFPTPPGVPFVPSLAALPDRSLTIEAAEKCHANLADPDLYHCSFGDPDGKIVVAIVGGSRIDHYVDAFDLAGARNGWRIDTMVKSGCQFTASDDEIGGEHRESCMRWNTAAFDALAAQPPDLIVLLGSRNFSDQGERFLPGVAERFKQLEAFGVRGLAVRDLPRIPESWADCLSKKVGQECEFEVASHRFSTDMVQPETGTQGSHHWFDFLPYVCPEGVCTPTIGNVLTYYDRSHLTGTFSRSLAPAAADAVRAGLNLAEH